MPPKYCTDARNHRIATLPLSPSDQIPSAALFGLKKYTQKSGQICFALWRKRFCTLEKCILKFCPIAAATLPLSPSDEVPCLTKFGLKKLQTLQKPISFCILSCTQHQASIGFVFLCPHFYAHIYFFLHNSPCSASK